MNNDVMVSELQKMNNVLNTKDSFGLHPVVKSTEPFYFLPDPITLPAGRKYRAALIDFSSDNYFENINSHLENDKFFYSLDKGVTSKTITIARGYYDIDEFFNALKSQIVDCEKYMNIEVHLSTYKTIIEILNENFIIDFSQNGTFRKNLGFASAKLQGKKKHIAPKRTQITHIKRINIHCDLITGGYDSQGKKSDIILSYPTGEFEPARVVALRPNVPLYLPVVKDVIG